MQVSTWAQAACVLTLDPSRSGQGRAISSCPGPGWVMSWHTKVRGQEEPEGFREGVALSPS